MQNMLKFGLKTLFLLVVLLGVGAIYSIDQSQTYGRLINYVGIVRGATQRLVKLELAQEPHDDLIAYLDGIQDELLSLIHISEPTRRSLPRSPSPTKKPPCSCA